MLVYRRVIRKNNIYLGFDKFPVDNNQIQGVNKMSLTDLFWSKQKVSIVVPNDLLKTRYLQVAKNNPYTEPRGADADHLRFKPNWLN